MALMTLLKDKDVKRGFHADPDRERALEFGVSSISGTEFMLFRIGRIVAQAAGFKAKDRVTIVVDKQDKDGSLYARLEPNPKGWVLQAADPKADNPSLVLRITWRDKWPYLGKMTACQRVTAKDFRINFIFPEGTTLGKPEPVLEMIPEGVPEEVYNEHKEIVERDLPRRKKKDNGHFRRKADKAPSMKDGKPYGRRYND